MEKEDGLCDWASVDHANDPNRFVNYLDTATIIDFFQAYKRETYSLMNLGKGSCVLDVGCGAGDDVLALTQIVGSKGRVVGIDNSEIMVDEAKKRASREISQIEFYVKDAHDLDFCDDTFDACRADRVFQHLEMPKRALSEMIRVVRPESRIVISEPDWETLVVDMPNKNLTRRILNYFCDKTINGWFGRELFRLFRTSGLINTSIIPRTFTLTDYAMADQLFDLKSTALEMQKDGNLTENEAAEWLEYLQNASENRQFFCAVTGFIAIGTKPR